MITQLVERALQGDKEAHESLRIAVYDLITAQARYAVHGERKGHTFQVTALANEIWKSLDEKKMIPVLAAQNTARAKALIGTMIRHFLVSYGRRHLGRHKAEEGYQREHADLDIELDLTALAPGAGSIPVSIFTEALEKLTKLDPEAGEVFQLRVFAGLKWTEIAEMMDRAIRTVQLAYQRAQIFLSREIRRSNDS